MPNLRTPLAFVACLAVLAGAAAVAQECPRLVGIWPYGPILNVGAGVDGHVAILTGAAFQVLDVDNPAVPMVIGEVAIPNCTGVSLDLRGDRAYVSEWEALGIVDLADPHAPTRVGEFRYIAEPRQARFLDAVGGRAYVADGGLRILDVTDPADPRNIGLWGPPPGAGVGMAAADGTVVYVSTYPQGPGVHTLHVVDVTQPASPVELDSLGFADRILGVVAGDDLAYVLTESGMSVVDVAGVSGPYVVGSYTLPEPLPTFGWFRRLARVASTLYIADTGIRIIDVSDPEHPLEVGFFDGDLEFAVAPGYCYIARWDCGLRIVDVSDPGAPVEVGTLPSMDFMSDISVSDGVAAIAATRDGLRLLDVTAPASPVEVSVVPAPGDAWVFRVERSGDLVFATTDFSWWIVDVSDPLAPVTLSTPRFPGMELAVDGGYAYYCNTSNVSMTVVDVSDPANPFEAGMVGGDAYGWYIDADSQRVYTASSPGLTVVDVSDPWNPFILGTAQSPPYVRGVAVSGATAVRITEHDGLRIFDVSDPTNPVEASWMDIGMQWDIEMEGHRAFAVGGPFGLLVIDVGRPDAPFEAGRAAGVNMDRVAVDHPYVYSMSYGLGVRIYDLSGCDAIVFRDGFESGDTSRWPITVP